MPDAKENLRTVDIVRLARDLGVQVGKPRDGQAQALCPFHKESTPSFTLYEPRKAGERSRYYCFGCQAQGGAIDLVRGLTGSRSYRDAGVWLEDHGYLPTGSFSATARQAAPAPPALQQVLERLPARSAKALIDGFARARDLPAEVLRSAQAHAGDLGPVIAQIDPMSPLGLELVEQGLARIEEKPFFGPEPTAPPLRSNIAGQRVLLPIRDASGELVGLIARAARETDKPKYQLPTGFPRGDHLYGLDRARDHLAGSDAPLDLFVVEGPIDALRLRSLGFTVVALLGVQLTDAQAKLIEQLARDAGTAGRATHVHVFLDHDAAGRTASARLAQRLIARSHIAHTPFLVDVIVPPSDTPVGDPDTLLKNVSREEAPAILTAWARSVLDVVVSVQANLPVERIREHWHELDWPAQFAAAQRIGRQLGALQPGQWADIQARLRPDQAVYGRDGRRPADPDLFATQISLLVSRAPAQDALAPIVRSPVEADAYPARLLSALELAREAGSSREYPVDAAAWDRLSDGALVFGPALRSRLGRGDGPSRPFTAQFLPRSNGAPRLKCGPCPEDATLQQYVLGELLRRHNSSRYMQAVPAVRWWPSLRETQTTGRGDAPGPNVSFAYQIDMEALESRPNRPRRRDMFRPFIECWNAYIAFAGHRISRMRGNAVHVARLDISRFYDELPRGVIEHRLQPALAAAMACSPVTPASLFKPDVQDPSDRAKLLCNWMLDHSMGSQTEGYRYFHPVTGEVQTSGGARRGLPQGPTLSAYLANIALFGLDQTMVEEVTALDRKVGGPSFGGLYARYVDDIILAAPSEAELRHLISRVEGQVADLGLRLNDKSEVLLPKSKSEAREWLVERRGAGFVEYGDAAEAPTPVLDVATSWGDTPDLDRRAALHVVLDVDLDDPKTTSASHLRHLLTRVAQAADAPHGDLGHVARRLWLRVAIEVAENGGEEGAAPLSDAFSKDWSRIVSNRFVDADGATLDADGRALAASLEAIAILDGAERLLTGAPHRNPTLTLEGLAAIEKGRRLFVSAVAQGLLPPVIAAALKGHPGVHVQLVQWQAILEARAATILRTEGQEPDVRDAATLPKLAPIAALESVRVGQIAEYGSQSLEVLTELLNHALGEPSRPDAANRILHIGVALMQALSRLGGTTAQAGNRLSALEHSVALQLADVEVRSFPAPDDARAVLDALRLWFTQDAATTGAEGEAAVAFVQLLHTSSQFSLLLERRPLVAEVLGGARMRPVPQPPLPKLPGVFFRGEAGEICAVLIDQEARNAPDLVLPRGFDWDRIAETDTFTRYVCTLDPDLRFLSADTGQAASSQVAELYKVFYEFLRMRVDKVRTPLTSAFALLAGPEPAGPEETRRVQILAWWLAPAQIKDLAFPRRGGVLSVQRLVEAEGDWLWRLGRAFNDLYGTPFVADTPVDDDPLPHPTVLEIAIRRKVLSQLSGPRQKLPVADRSLREGKLPATLQRGLNALSIPVAQASPLIWLHFFEGRLMAERMRHAASFTLVQGGAAHLLTALGRRALNPKDDAEALAISAERDDPRLGTDVNGWFAVATGIRALDTRFIESDAEHLQTVAAGVELEGLSVGFRDLVMGLIARMTPSDRALIRLAVPDLADWGFGSDAVFILSEFGGLDAERGAFDLDHQITDLFAALSLVAATPRRTVVDQVLARITLLGWTVALGVLTSVLSARFPGGDDRETRPTLQASRPESDLGPQLRTFAEQLLGIGREPSSREWPWDIFGPEDQAIPDLGRSVLATALTDSEIHFGPVMRTAGLITRDRGDGVRVQDRSFGELQLSAFQYLSTGIVQDGRRDLETVVEEDSRVLHVWNGLFRQGDPRPLVITRLTEVFAARVRRAGEAAVSKVPPTSDAHDEPVATPALPLDDGSPVESPRAVSTSPPGRGEDQEPTPDLEPEPDDGDLEVLRALQRRSWRDRGGGDDLAKGLGKRHMARIAFLQNDFEESYDDPQSKAIQYYKGRREAAKHRYELVSGGVVTLCPEEWRRRRVLTRVVEACEAFGVEILVLPEYSMRPETVFWLARTLEVSRSGLSVWAGTFRVPSAFDIHVDEAQMRGVFQEAGAAPTIGMKSWARLQSVAPVIFRDGLPEIGDGATGEDAALRRRKGSILVSRQKRYPAIAFHEEFVPATVDSQITPLLASSRSPFRAESYVFELICSEIFAFNGPINVNAMVESLIDLHVRFGLQRPSEDLRQSVYGQITKDQDTLAKWVSHSFERQNWPRRSILLAPCITRRSLDYQALGVNAHLSAGVATVFCNSTVRGYSNGGSCFIGFGATETRPQDAGFILGPYHGAAPGVYAPMVKEARPLGEHECALVIVDIDAEHPTQANPRPQYRGDPAQLIAHLPLIAHAEENDLNADWMSGAKKSKAVRDLAAKMVDQAAGGGATFGHTPSAASKARHAAALALTAELSRLAPESPGLKSRAKRFSEAGRTSPQLWPPPVLMDWIDVDLGVDGFLRLQDDQPNLDEDPWIWITPPPNAAASGTEVQSPKSQSSDLGSSRGA